MLYKEGLDILLKKWDISRNIGYDWQFSDEQKKLLKRYYDTNKLLVDCLNSDCSVSLEVQQEIEDTLFLPMAEIEKRKDRLS